MNKKTQSLIESIESYPETFEWTPSPSRDPVGKKELIDELRKGGPLGRMFIDEVAHRTVQRMMKDANRRKGHRDMKLYERLRKFFKA